MVELENYEKALKNGVSCIAMVNNAFANVDCKNKTPEEIINEGCYAGANAINQAMIDRITSL